MCRAHSAAVKSLNRWSANNGLLTIKGQAQKAINAVRDGRIRIVPDYFTKVYFNWMENIQDWCISRQLWWGHRIPVWYCD